MNKCAVEVSTKKGKTGADMWNMCKVYFSWRSYYLYDNYCQRRFKENDPCRECPAMGRVSVILPLRACNRSLKFKTTYVMRVITVISGNCEAGNKSAYPKLKLDLESSCMDPDLAFVTILPDTSHVENVLKHLLPTDGYAKIMNVGISVWWEHYVTKVI